MADSTYDECFLKGHSECGQFAAKRSNEMFKFCEVNESVESHFRTLKIKLPAANDSLASIRTEKGLILDRVNIKEDNVPDNAKICSRHRYYNGVCYHIRRQCAHPKHEELRKKNMSKTKKISFKTASIPLVGNIRKKFNVHFPVGGQLCTICRNVTEKSNCTNKLADGNTDIEEAEVQEDEDVTFHSASTVSELNSSIKELAPAISPFKFQLRSAVELVVPSTVRYLKRKLDSCEL